MNRLLFVACRGGDEAQGHWGTVGRLDHDGERFRFHYTKGARNLPGFQAFQGMPDLESVYESDQLFPLFANRLLSKSRPEYQAFLTWGGFDPDSPPDPIALLGVTGGRRATDSLELFPCPVINADRRYTSKFFLHGIRWMPEAAIARLAQLQPGERLPLMLDGQNPQDPYAVAVRSNDPDAFMLGYVPRYFARDIRELCQSGGSDAVKTTVERLNPDAPSQQRLLCRLDVVCPEGFVPCMREEYLPITDVSVSAAA